MRVALRRNATRQRVSIGSDIPAPVKGIDAISPLESMKPEFAIQLDNLFCQPGYLELRPPHVAHCDLGQESTPVESLMAYHGASSNALFAAAGTSIHDVTTATPSEDVTNLANARWQHLNFATSGGHFLLAYNGADTPLTYDGSTWGTATISGSVTGSDIVGATAHKSRLWFVEAGTSDAHYLPVDSIQGTAAAFPLGGLFTKGGILQAIGSWSYDGGAGPDDLLAFVSSRGQVAVYAGVDPTDSTDFGVVGVFDTAPPIGRRCLVKVGADLALVTIDGILPLSRALATDRAANLRIALTQRIQPLIAELAKTHSGLFGWQLIGYPRKTMAVFTIPTAENATAVQYVMNTITGAWSKFTGWDANCFEIFEDRCLFGGNDGKVYEVDVEGSAAIGSITVDMRTAFNYLDKRHRGQIKDFKAIRALPGRESRLVPRFAVNVDFRDDAALASAATPQSTQALWDQAEWDVALWPKEGLVQARWMTVHGQGDCASVRMSFDVDATIHPTPFRVSSFGIVYEPGAIMT